MHRFVQSKDVAWNFLGDSVIAFNLSGEKEFHELNPTAATVFSALSEPKSEEELTMLITSEFEVDPSRARLDLEALLIEMREKRLIVEA